MFEKLAECLKGEIGIHQHGAAGGGETQALEEVFFRRLEREAEHGGDAAEAFEQLLRIGFSGADGFGMKICAHAKVDPGLDGGEGQGKAFEAADAAFGKGGGDGGEVEMGFRGEGGDEVEQVDGNCFFELAAVDHVAQGSGTAGDGDARIEKGDGLLFFADEGEAFVGEFLGAGKVELGLEAGVGDAAVDKLATNEDEAVAAAEAVDDFVHALQQIDARFAAEGLESNFALGRKEGRPGGSLLEMVHAEAQESGGVLGDEGGQSGVYPLADRFALAGSEGQGGQKEVSP